MLGLTMSLYLFLIPSFLLPKFATPYVFTFFFYSRMGLIGNGKEIMLINELTIL